jgi:hypothetical protein
MGIGPIIVIVGILALILSVIVFALLSPILDEFIGMGVAASDDHDDPITGFLLKIIPLWIIFIFLGMLVYVIASGGNG